MSEYLGCGNHGCQIEPPQGIGTNGPCQCFSGMDKLQALRVKKAFTLLRAEVERLERKNRMHDTVNRDQAESYEKRLEAAEQKAAELQGRVDAYANFTASIMSMARLNIDGVICLMSDSIDHAYRFLRNALNLQHKPTETDLTTKD